MLIFNTVGQFAVLGLLLVAGWFFGFASAPGGRKWKERLREEEIEHARTQDQLIADVKAKDKRIAELEKERDAALKNASTAAPVASADVEPAKGDGWRGWFGWGRDNLARIKGIDEAREKRLNELGYKTYREIEGMSDEDEAKLEERLELEKGTIAKEGWRDQAKLLRDGNEEEHAKQYV